MSNDPDRFPNRNNRMAAITAACQEMVAGGASREAMLANLYAALATTFAYKPSGLDAVMVIRSTYGLGLFDAVFVLLEDPIWNETADLS